MGLISTQVSRMNGGEKQGGCSGKLTTKNKTEMQRDMKGEGQIERLGHGDKTSHSNPKLVKL